MTLDELIVAVRSQMGTATNDAFFTDDVLTSLINSSIQFISMLADWPWLLTEADITTVGDQQTYDLPDAYRKTKLIGKDGSRKLEWLHLESMLSGHSSNSKPLYYYIADKVYFYPVPGEDGNVFRHFFYQQEPALVDGTDTPIMPEVYQYSIVHYAAKLAWDRGQRDQDSSRELASFQALMKEVLKAQFPTTGPLTPRAV